jgi:hypothetical protein
MFLQQYDRIIEQDRMRIKSVIAEITEKRPRILVRGLIVLSYVLWENFPLINSLSVEIENNTFAGRRRAAGTLNFQA